MPINKLFARAIGKAFQEFSRDGNTARLNRRLNIGKINAVKQRKFRKIRFV